MPAFLKPPHQPRSLWHRWGPGPVIAGLGRGGKKKKRERNESHRREGHGAAAGHCPAPPGWLDQALGARCHPEPPVSPPTPGGTEEAFSPLPASAENKGAVCFHLRRRPQRGHCHHRPPTPGPSAPPASPPPAPSPAWPREPAPTAAGTCCWPSRRRWPSLGGGTQRPPATIVLLPWETAHGQAVASRGWSSPRGGERGGARPFSLSSVPPAALGLWGSPGTPLVEEDWGGSETHRVPSCHDVAVPRELSGRTVGRARHHLAPRWCITPRWSRKGAIVRPDPASALRTALQASSLPLKAVTTQRACSGSQASGGCTGIQRPRARPAA